MRLNGRPRKSLETIFLPDMSDGSLDPFGLPADAITPPPASADVPLISSLVPIRRHRRRITSEEDDEGEEGDDDDVNDNGEDEDEDGVDDLGTDVVEIGDLFDEDYSSLALAHEGELYSENIPPETTRLNALQLLNTSLQGIDPFSSSKYNKFAPKRQRIAEVLQLPEGDDDMGDDDVEFLQEMKAEEQRELARTRAEMIESGSTDMDAGIVPGMIKFFQQRLPLYHDDARDDYWLADTFQGVDELDLDKIQQVQMDTQEEIKPLVRALQPTPGRTAYSTMTEAVSFIHRQNVTRLKHEAVKLPVRRPNLVVGCVLMFVVCLYVCFWLTEGLTCVVIRDTHILWL